MDSLDLMMQEHQNIRRFTEIIRGICCRVLEGEEVEDAVFRDILFFARTYADRLHHGKEEKILFQEMMQNLGPLAVKLIQNGMMVEHDLGRLFLMELEQALDRYKESHRVIDRLGIVTNASGWADLLQRHMDREDSAVYEFARRNLPAEVMDKMNNRILQFLLENEAKKEQALEVLERLAESA